MARLSSDSNMGFYPTDTKTIKKVIDKVINFPENKVITALDSCAGEGTAIEFISKEYKCDSYAIELNKYRVQTIIKKGFVNKTLHADALNDVRKSNSWVAINFLNPPYGTDIMGNRLEQQFIERYGNCTCKNGVLILVINPSSINEDMVRALRRQGYKAVGSFYDEDNEDYIKYGQRFVILQRVAPNFRDSLDNILYALEHPIDINLELEFEKISISSGGKPEMFKEISVPDWKIHKELNKSNLEDTFFNNLKRSKFSTSSIEHPNEGQSAILIASGALNKAIELADGTRIILKGTSKKVTNEVVTALPEGNISGVVKVRESYKTVVYGLNLTFGEFNKFE